MAVREFLWTKVSSYMTACFVNRKWYFENPREMFRQDDIKDEAIKNKLSHHKSLESTSYVLAGSSLVGLTFIISSFYNELVPLEPAISFFAITFILESVSAFAFHDLTKNFWGYFGQVLQYAGVISLLMGFHVFIFSQEVLNWSLTLHLIFPIGITLIIILTFREFLFYLEYMHNSKNG